MNNLQQNTFKNKIIVITGASSGVGRAVALSFATLGANLVLAARRTNALLELEEECELLGAKAIAVNADVTDYQSVKKLATAAIDYFGKIDVWINNAGVLAAGQFDETPMGIHEQVIKTNLLGYMHGAHVIMPLFKKQGCGTLINNISVGAWMPTPYATAYTASKFGLLGFSESLKAELSSWKDIHVCDLFPAFLDTPGIQHAANYTGRVLKPAPPVFDPQRVANAMVKLAVYPKNSTVTDFAAPALKLSYSLFPALTRNITAKLIKGYLYNADLIDASPGNVLDTVKYGTSVYGGWINQFKRQAKPLASKVAALVLVTAGLSLFLLSRTK